MKKKKRAKKIKSPNDLNKIKTIKIMSLKDLVKCQGDFAKYKDPWDM